MRKESEGRMLSLPVILSWVRAQAQQAEEVEQGDEAEQGDVLLGDPPVAPAGSWRALNLCVRSSLPRR